MAGRSRFMGKIRHLRGVRRSTKRLRLSPLHKQQTGQPLQCCPLRQPKKRVQKKGGHPHWLDFLYSSACAAPPSPAYNPSYVAAHLPCPGLRLALNFTKSRIRRRSMVFLAADHSHEQAEGFARRSVNRTKLRNVPVNLDCDERLSPKDPEKWECGSHGMKEWANIAKVVACAMTRQRAVNACDAGHRRNSK